MSQLQHDLVNHLISISPETTLAQLRATRQVATDNTQAAFDALFSIESAQLSLPLRNYLAALTARETGSNLLADFYQRALADQAIDIDNPLIKSALNYVNVIIHRPKQANLTILTAMLDAGWQNAEIILLAQLVTFVTYQARLVEGLRLLQGKDNQLTAQHTRAGEWNSKPQTVQGQRSPTAFTQAQLDWSAWLPARAPATLSPDEAAVMKKMGQLNSEYFLLLAHQSQILAIRTQIDRGVFYTTGGLARWEREFAATVASKVNGCIYCASVHARKASQYAKNQVKEVNQLLATPAGEILAQQQDARLRALTDFTASLSATPIQATLTQVTQLRRLGLSELELLDLMQSTAFFSWANRLMLSLGEPVETIENEE